MEAGTPGERLPAFRASRPLTLGVELELMLVDRSSGQLASESPALLDALEGTTLAAQVKAEITQAMIELTSAVHDDAETLERELRRLCTIAQEAAASCGLLLCGGGAHPFREWPLRDIYPSERFDRLYQIYGYLLKVFTVFGQHIHVGVPSGDLAIYLTHVFNGYLPHLIALAASSPYQRGVDTGYASSRANVFGMLPLSGHQPEVRDWREFVAYFARMQETGLVQSMKDFYWDVRPKPEFGTVEVRVCDTPLSASTAADLAALCQAIARRHLDARPSLPTARLYEVYAVNRFQAARSGFDAVILDAGSGKRRVLADAIAGLIDDCLPGCAAAAAARLGRLRDRALARDLDSGWIRETRQGCGSWIALMEAQAARLLAPAAVRASRTSGPAATSA
jgi:carboxylate-amine ligase